MAVDVIIDPGTGQIYWNDQAGSGTQTIAISGNATNSINVVGYSNFFSPGGGGIGTQILATFTDSATSTFTPGTNAYDLGSSSLRWNFYGTGGNFTGAISTSSTTDSTSSTTGALIVSGGAGIGASVNIGGRVGINTGVYTGAFNIRTPSTTTSGIIIRGNTSQTADAITYFSAAGDTQYAVDATGRVRLTGMDGIWSYKSQQNIFDVSDGRVNWNLSTWQYSSIYWVTAGATIGQASNQLQISNNGTTSITGVGVLANGWSTGGANRAFGIVSPSGSERTYFNGYGNLVINPNNPNPLHSGWNTMDLLTMDISGTASTYTGNIILGKVEGTERFSVGPYGNTKVSLGGTTVSNALILKGATSQTGNLMEFQSSTGTTYLFINSTGQFGPVTIASSTASTSSTTGALVVTGGVGIGGTLNVNTANVVTDFNHTPNNTTIGGASGWVASTASTFITPNSFRYLNNKYIGIGGTYVYYSDDMINWSSVMVPNLDPARNIANITYGEGKYVFVQYYTANAGYSTNLTNWTNVAITYQTWNDVIYGNGRFVATTGGDLAAYSLDGTSWTSVTDSVALGFNTSLKFLNGYFYVTNANAISRSIDGITWQVCNSPAVPYGLAYGNGLYVGGVYNSGTIVYSYDGLNFSSYSGSSFVHNGSFFYNGVYYLTTQNNNVIRYSTDGFNWTNSTGFPSAVNNLQYIKGFLYAGSGNTVWVTNATPGRFEVNPLRTGTLDDVEIGRLSPNNANFIDVSVNNNLNVSSQYSSTSPLNGALTVAGGVGIAKTSYFGQSVVIQGTTASGSTTTGSLTVTGGVGIGGSLNVFGTIDVSNNIEVLSQKEVRFFNSANTFYTGLRAGSSSANVTFTLPIADGSANQVLYTNGSAGLAWTTIASAITSLNGLTAATQTFATGTSGTDFNISSSTSTHTFNIPYAGAASTGLVTTQAQTIAGAKTFSGNTIVSSSTASTNQTTGALVVTGGVGIGGTLNVNSVVTYNRLQNQSFSGSSVGSTDGLMGNFSTNYQYQSYGNGIYVVSSGGANDARYSTDGVTWQNTTLPVNQAYPINFYGNGYFVLSASGSTTVLYSTNGSSWSQVSIGNTFARTSGVYGNGKYIIVGSGSTYNYSSNLTTWSSATLPFNSTWYITYGNGMFVALGNGTRNLLYSYDGLNWNLGNINTTAGPWSGIKYGNGVFVASSLANPSSNTSGTIYSYDGINWFQGSVSNQDFYNVAYGNGVYFGNNQNAYWTSTDGANWASAVSFSGGFQSYQSAYGYNKFNTIGRFIDGPTNTVTLEPKFTGEINNVRIGAVTPASGDFTNLSSTGSANLVGTVNANNLNILSKVNQTPVLGGFAGSTGWTSAGLLTGTNSNYALAFGNGLFVQIRRSTDYTSYSPDGKQWVASNMPFSGSWIDVAWGKDKFVAVSSTGASGSYSGNGITWTSMNMPTNTSGWYAVTYGNEKFVAVGNGATVAYSSDGISWTGAAIANTNWTGITYGNGTFVAVSGFGLSGAYSYDGINWNLLNLPTSGGTGVKFITYGNGYFIVTNYVSTAINYSRDGINWSTSTRTSTANIHTDLAYGNGIYSIFNYSETSYSYDAINWLNGNTITSTDWQAVAYGNNRFVATSVNTSYVGSIDGPSNTLNLYPKFTGDIDNVRIGANQPGAAEFTNLAAQQPVRFTAGTVSSSISSGALVVSGGAGIAKTSYFGQDVKILGSTASGSTTTGALTVSGGVGIGGSLNVFGTIDVADNIEVLSQKEVRFFNSANTFYTGLRAGSSAANVTFTLPVADGSANQVLYTNGSAGLAWTTIASVSAITTLNSLTASTQTFATGTSGSDFNISSGTSTHTFNIPYAGSGATGLVTTQAQTLAGSKTFSSQTIISDTTVSSSTATGALLVFGGLGVSGQVNAASLQTAGNALISGNLTFNGVGVFGNATSDTINSLARYISDILPSTDNSYDLGNNSLGWRNFRVSGVGTIATLQVTSVTSGVWSGTAISVSNGGTGRATLTASSVLLGNGTSAVGMTTGSSAQVLVWQSSGDPAFVSLSGDLTITAAGVASIAANSVALGTDTTGNYAQSVAVSGSGITLGGTAGEGTDFTVYSSGTSANTVSTLVLRDGSGNFSAGTITASLTGTASIATSSVNSATTTDTTSTLYLLGSRSSTGFAGTALYVDSSISILGSQITAGVWGGTAISAVNGGTGQVSYTVGDLLYASSTTALSKLAAGTAGSVLKSNGAGTAPSWQVDSTGGGGGSGTVTSGTAGSIAYYTGTGTTVGGSPGFTYTTSGTASTINVFGGSAIGTTIFTVQAYSATSVRVGIGTNLPQYELEIVGELSATNKSFVIDHPTKPGKKLRYGSLEGPENGVYVRGELKDSNIIETPDHWIGLVYPDSFTVTLTPIGRFSYLYVEKIEDYKVFIADAYMNPIHCYYTVWAERKDIPKLVTEY